MFKLTKSFSFISLFVICSACSESGSESQSVESTIKEQKTFAVDSAVPVLATAKPSESSASKVGTDKSIIENTTTEKFNIGTVLTKEQIAGWDIDVRPDGQGLPEGRGSVEQGEVLFEQQCASCHGTFGEGEGRWPVLAGGFDSLTEERPDKTVGSYWPYLSTLWDYIHRAMPFLSPQSLEDNEVYAITAYILYLNELVDNDFVLSKENFTSIKLPNELAFVDDPRPDVQNTRCMQDCRDKKSIKITWDSTALGVTPVAHLKSGQESEESAKGSPANTQTLPSSVNSSNEQAQEQSDKGQQVYTAACAVCHASGVAGAPIVGDAADWSARIKQGEELLYEHAINGFQGSSGFMPAKGGNASLADDDVKAAVDFMIE